MKITCFLVNADDFPAYSAMRAKAFPSDPPASSTVVVRALVLPDCLIEVEAIAIAGHA